MSEGLNEWTGLGNLGQDPELRFTQGGEAVMNLRLATTEVYFDRDKQKKEKTNWHNVVVWGKRAEALSSKLGKGAQVMVKGPIENSSYEGRDGQKRFKTEIKARQLIVLRWGDDNDAPRQQQQSNGGQRGYQHAPAQAPPVLGPDDDDLPF